MRFSRFLQGVKAELPLLVGVAPFGMIYGVLAIQAGIIKIQAQAMSSIIFAGSSQIVFTQLVLESAPGLVIVVAVLVVNLRHALYSAWMAPYLQRLSRGWKLLLAYLLTDEAYVVSAIHYEKLGYAELHPTFEQEFQHYYLFGAGLALWTTWQVSTAFGLFLGTVIPSSWSLDFTLALTFIALVVPNLRDRAGVITAVSAGVVAVLATNLPYKVGLVIAVVIGVVAGMLMEKGSAEK